MAFEIYRNTSIGDSLQETVEEMIEEGKIGEQLAKDILARFDKSMSEAMRTLVTGKAHIKADIQRYNYHDNVWTFNLKNVEFSLNQAGTGSMKKGSALTMDMAKVVVVDAKLAEPATKR